MMLVVAQRIDLCTECVETAERVDGWKVDVVRSDGGDAARRVADLAFELPIAAVRDGERSAEQQRQHTATRERGTSQEANALPTLSEANRGLIGENRSEERRVGT